MTETFARADQDHLNIDLVVEGAQVHQNMDLEVDYDSGLITYGFKKKLETKTRDLQSISNPQSPVTKISFVLKNHKQESIFIILFIS